MSDKFRNISCDGCGHRDAINVVAGVCEFCRFNPPIPTRNDYHIVFHINATANTIVRTLNRFRELELPHD